MPLEQLRDEPWQRRIPTPALLRACLDTDLYRRLPDDHRIHCEERILHFLERVEIVGILEHRVTVLEAVRVAFSCGLLYAGRPEWSLPPKMSVRISPKGFDEQRIPTDGKVKWAGWVCPSKAEVWVSTQSIGVSFKSADGYHAPIHEFAHVLDFGILEPGREADGIPRDLGLSRRAPWLGALDRVKQRVSEADGDRIVRRYAASHPAEAFACVVEAFFERPAELREWDSGLYAMLSTFLNQDPARG
jgi:hypothetical protein